MKTYAKRGFCGSIGRLLKHIVTGGAVVSIRQDGLRWWSRLMWTTLRRELQILACNLCGYAVRDYEIESDTMPFRYFTLAYDAGWDLSQCRRMGLKVMFGRYVIRRRDLA